MAIKKSELYSSLWQSCDELRGGMGLSENDIPDFNNEDKLGKGKEMMDRLSNLVAIFNTPALDFRGNRAEGDDLLGDAYEYLMRHFAEQSGKSKGQFLTPAEVSRLMAKVLGVSSAKTGDSIYDPTCGSGSLLLKVHDEVRNRTRLDLALYGQEMDNATAALARMNMILHGCPYAEIWKDNTLANPYFKNDQGRLKTFDFVVANFPFSNKAWSNGVNVADDPWRRFELGVPPAKNGDYAFLLHILTSLKSTGKGAVIHPHGVLFRGGTEAAIRREIVKRGYIKGIIGLPANLFYGTGIPACILVLDKENAHARQGIFMIDASKSFIKDGNKNRLRAQDLHRIADTFDRQAEIAKYSRMAPAAEIEANDYNLNIPRYIDSTEPEDVQDIDAHLKGGIPDRDIADLERYWAVLPGLKAALFTPADRPGYSRLNVPVGEIKPTIFNHAEFTAFNDQVSERFATWREANRPRLTGIQRDDHPKALIDTLAEHLLETFRPAPLLDAYDVYQHLLDYWEEAMQDDVYLLAQEGWQAVLDGKPNTDLIPSSLIVNHFFIAEQRAIESQEAQRDAISRKLEEMEEEHGGEEGLLEEAKTEKGKLTVKSTKERLKAIQTDAEAAEERRVLMEYAGLLEREAVASKKVKDAQKALNTKVLAQYAKLTEAEIRKLVVDDKWLVRLAADVQSELDRVSQALTGRIRQLAERYATRCPGWRKKWTRWPPASMNI